ncbi:MULTISPECIES: MgtC/SapB family protein [unclassified Beijerinckia]|uniref:MgtC/SapB family protein n=1 Tax=unclassified Beijerinckia TaxID=2638183 RepID=UPI000894276E|nr:MULTISPECIES: MgtC/SapB family protein [unclassified Beijerinckia]MDH7796155.1 putative Mg2+ transporter-C (MgtC) family protein [Beijerinckia sp. GAS462]SEC32789.1 putative Mg2+ transporter-C (MgtC) family protein [Beijerinckia sp. 28-YEA-48]
MHIGQILDSIAQAPVGPGTLAQWEFVLRLFVAAILGSLIGIERERLAWAAGLRTHMLVSVGSCLVMIVSAFGFADVLGGQNIVLDPSRIAAQVVSGIGFVGAGCILLRGEIVRGLTTAASLWTVAAIGLAVGGGLYIGAVAATLIVLTILAGVKPLEEWLQHRYEVHQLDVLADHRTLSYDQVRQILGYRSTRMISFVSEPAEDGAADQIQIRLHRMPTSDLHEVVRLLATVPHVRSVMSV